MIILLFILNIVRHCLHVWTEERSGELSCCFVFIWARRGWRPEIVRRRYPSNPAASMEITEQCADN